MTFDTPVRAPQLGRSTFPARRLDLQADAAPLTTDDSGAFSWTTTGMDAGQYARREVAELAVLKRDGISFDSLSF